MLAAQAGSIEPGAEAETVVLVRNTGATADVFHVVVQGEASAWAVVDPPSVSLEPGQEAPVWVHFRPPRSSDTPPGVVPFAVAVASTGDPDFVAVETGELHIGTFSSLTAALTADPAVGALWTELSVSVRNTGNRRVTAHVEVEAATAGVSAEVDPPEIVLDPGQPAVALVRVRPPRRVLPRGKEDRRLIVSVVSDGGALATIRTEYPADPSLVNELIRSARVLFVLLVLLFVGGVLVLRSETTSGTVAVTQDGGPEAQLPTTVPPAPDDRVGTTTTEAPAAAEAEAAPVTPVPASAPKSVAPSPPLPQLVFVRVYGPSQRDIVVRQAGATGKELRLRSDGALETRPRLSPDGEHIAFLRERDGAWRVCVIPTAGGEAVCVADTSSDAAVSWAPDGRALLFSRGGRLFAVTYDPATDTVGPEEDRDVAVPGGAFALSPDGTRIAVGDGRRLFVRPVDGSPGTVIETPSAPQDPVFSPDGNRLAYTADYQIYTVGVGGGAVRQVTSPGTVNGDAAWTAEGDWIVFRSNRSGSGDLYAAAAATSGGAETNLAQVTSSGERDVTPSF